MSEMLTHGFDSTTAKRIDARLEQGSKTDAGAQCPPDLKQAAAGAAACDWSRDVHDTFDGIFHGLELTSERSALGLRTLDQLDQIEASACKESDKRVTLLRCVQVMMPHTFPYVWPVEIGQNLRILQMMKAARFTAEELQRVGDELDFKIFLTFPTLDELATYLDSCKKNKDWLGAVTEFKFDPLEQAVRSILYDVPKQ